MPQTQAAPAADNPPAQPQQEGGIPGWAQSLLRGVVIWYLMSSISSYMSGKKPEAPLASHSATQQANIKPSKTGSYMPMWKYGAHMDLFVYLSKDEYWHAFDERSLIWHEHDVVYGDWEEKRSDIEIEVPESVQNNGSLYAHIYLAEVGHSPNRQDPSFREESTLYHNKLLTRYMPKRKIAKVKKLIAGATSEPEPEELQEDSNEPTPIVSYWWNNVTIAIVNSDTTIPALLPAPMMKNVRVHEDGMRYFPVLYVNDFWLLNENLHPINTTVKTLQLALSYTPIPWWKYQMYAQFDESFKMQQNVLGAAESDMDDVKRMFLETNPILLGVTMAVSLLHSAFDFLAFKNDIQFWRKRKDMEGLSFRTIILNVFFQTVTLLYLMDNETSWMIIISSGVGLLIEMWKINKTVIVKRTPSFPYVEFIDRVKPSKLVSKTKEYDEMAFRYLSYVLYPLLAGYVVYSLLYQEHKGWYSFIISTLVGFVYMFGFITMTPQLFINYKLKSVAHMPWKTFMYKALNTFIDDLFAFVIKMPTLHRLACLRDDVIFVVYLYQRWIYPEDKRRRNEFGQVGEEEEEEEEQEEQEARSVKEGKVKGKPPAVVESKKDK